MIKKFMIIILFAFFMISAVSASEINETAINDLAESQIHEFIEVNQIDIGEEITIDDIVEKDVVIGEENIAPMKSNYEYNDSYIINSHENYNEIENNQYNNSYIDALINENLDNVTVLELNNSIVVPVYISDNMFMNHFISCMELNSIFETIDFGEGLSKFKDEIDKFKVLTHDDLIFYNEYYHILTHDVEKNIVLSDDKLHTKFMFSIDNSIVGSADCFIYGISNSIFSNFNLLSLSCFQTFSNFVQIFININYYEHAFFPSKTIE